MQVESLRAVPVRWTPVAAGAASQEPVDRFVPSEREDRVTRHAFQVLEGNRMTVTDPAGRNHTFATPSLCTGQGDSHLDYGGKQWLWDSAAHSMILSLTQPEQAREELQAVFANQNLDPASPDYGFVPHMNYFRGDGRQVPEWARPHLEAFRQTHPDTPASFLETYWSDPCHSDLTQPPILAMAALEVHRAAPDKQALTRLLPHLTAYYDYLDRRRADERGLLAIIHPWESGWDNSQRWDAAVGVPSDRKVERSQLDLRKMALFSEYKAMDWDLDAIKQSHQFDVRPVDFNVLYARNLDCLAELCRQAGDEKLATRYAERAHKTAGAIFEHMWDGDKYVDLVNGQASPVKSAAMFYPMMLPGEPHGRELVTRHLANPKEFNDPRGYAVPTTSLDHPGSDGDSYWRGNVWGIVNFFVWCGLEQRLKEHPGEPDTAAMAERVKSSTFELLDRGDFYEYFSPEGGKGFGVPSFGWNGLAVRMLHPPAFLSLPEAGRATPEPAR